MNKNWLGIAATLVLIAALSLGYQQLSAQPVTGQAPAETAVARRGTLLVTVDATGSLAPHSEVKLAFSSGGRVAEVLAVEGQVVEAGQPLARLDTGGLTLQVAQAEAMLAAAEAQLAQLLAPPQPEKVAAQAANLRAMQARLSAAAAERDQITAGADAGQIADAEAQVASAIAQQKSAFDRHEMTMKCFTVNPPAGVEMTICPALGAPEEQARYALAVADASLAAAQAQLDELQAGANTDQARAAQANVATAAAQRDAAQAQLDLLLAGPTEAQIKTTQALVDDARTALEQARLRLKKGALIAPMAGTVTFLDARPGEIVNANRPIAALSDLATLEVNVNLDETDVAGVAVGQKAQISLDAFPNVELTGEVTYIAPTAQTQTGVVLYPVTIRLTPTDLPVRAGMTADVEITTASQENALIVPLRAIEIEGEHAYVQRLAGDQVERVQVTLGMMTETDIEIIGGLVEGDTVVVVPSAPSSTSSGLFGMFGGGQ